MFAIGIVAQFEAAHRLRGDFGPASRVHGHTYRVEVEASGTELQPDGTLFDIGKLRPWVDETVAALNYQNLDELPAFADRNTTAETVAHYIWRTLAHRLSGHRLANLTVRVWESPQVYAAYSGDLE
jgi:6-pyruvoyltetrahydropterin/6-carboxytetrahydropterin synthase